MSKTDTGDILDLDGSDDDNEVLGAAKTAESMLAQTDIEDMLKVVDPVGLDSWDPFKGIDAPEGTHTLVSIPLFVLDQHLNTLLAR